MSWRRELKNIRSRKLFAFKCFKVALFLGLVWLIYHTLSSFGGDGLSPVNVTYVVVHLDLKRTPLNLKYLEDLLPTLKKHGVNGLLMEYEDMFPFEGNLVNLSSKAAYNRKELKQFLQIAERLEFEIIPLVQTLGHMEYVLKLKQFHHLREDPKHDDCICPSKEDSLDLIEDILNQVISFHNNIAPLKHVHVGCDEVYRLNQCKDCLKRKLINKWIYLHHIDKINKIVKAHSKEMNVLFWDDMLRTISPRHWGLNYKIQMEPVYWNYLPNVKVSHASLLQYHRTFPNIWIATAFKGADGEFSTLPNIRDRFLNHFTWLKTIRNYKFGGESKTYNFKGIILTGWSRYKHKSKACDLLPASLPSLILNLLLIKDFQSNTIGSEIPQNPRYFYENFEKKMKSVLNCYRVFIEYENFGNKTPYNFDFMELDSCQFDGAELYDTLKMYENLKREIDKIHNSSNLGRKTESKRKEWCEDTWMSINYLENEFAQNMRPYYDEVFITEFIFEKILSIKVKLKYCFD